MRKFVTSFFSCLFPFGKLDVIRIVHSNGHIEEINGRINATDIMKAYPNHVLMKYSTSSSFSSFSALHGGAAVVPNFMVVPPYAELQRGKVYFIKPLPSPPSNKVHTQMKKKKEHGRRIGHNNSGESTISVAEFGVSSDRGGGHVSLRKPLLASISE